MAYKVFKRSTKKTARKLKKRFIFLLLFVPLFLLATSFFVFAAAQDNASEKAVDYWNKNCDEIASGNLQTDLAGIIQFDAKTTVPYYIGIDNTDSKAVLFGMNLPGQAGRSVILGQNENDFVYLSQLNIGDEITVESCSGRFVYTVSAVNVVVPSEIPLFETEDSVLTLITQYPFRTLSQANRRYVVEAVLLS